MVILNLLPGLFHYSSFWPRCTIKYMTNLCSLYFKHVSRTSFMHSYRNPAQNSGFSNKEPSYGNFKLFGYVIAVFLFLDMMYYKVHDQFV